MEFKGFHKYVGNKYTIQLWYMHKNIACSSKKKNKEHYNICRIQRKTHSQWKRSGLQEGQKGRCEEFHLNPCVGNGATNPGKCFQTHK